MGDIRAYLRHLRKGDDQSQTQPTQDVSEESVPGIDLQEFGRENLVVLVRSYLLDDDICLVSNRRRLKHVEGDYVTYLPEELQFVYRMLPESLKKAHLAKKFFGGVIENIEIFRENSLK